MLQSIKTIDIAASDYDRTIADTFTPSPNGITVERAYRYAIGDIFGSEQLFDDSGGLKNRAPAEIVIAILSLDRGLKDIGHQYYERHKRELRGLVPKGKGVHLQHPGLIDMLTETLVRVKLRYLLGEICETWPKPYDGFLDTLEELRRQNLHFAIITSGHDLFVERTFKLWGAPQPAFMVTDDDMRTLGLPADQACKPSPLLIDLLKGKIKQAEGKRAEPNIKVYLGDCQVKDRGLAWNAKLRFGWFNPDGVPRPQGFGRNEFEFSRWRQLPAML